MSQSIDINNVQQLDKLIKIMETNSGSVEGLLNRFPFHLLCEVSQLNVEVMCGIVNVLKYFICRKEMYRNGNYVLMVMMFYLKSLNFLLHNKDTDYTLLHKILSEFYNSFQSAIQFGKSYSISVEVLRLIEKIVNHSSVANEIRHTAIELLCHFLHKHQVQLNQFNECVSNVWNAPIDETTKLTLAQSLICHPQCQTQFIPVIHDAYNFFIHNVQLDSPDLSKNIEKHLYEKNIDLVLCVYKKCQDTNLLRQLSIKLIKDNLHKKSLFTSSTNDTNKYLEILYFEINVLFESTPWQGNLQSAINEFVNKRQTICSDLSFVLNYLDLLHSNLRLDSQKMTNDLLRNYSNKIPENPPVLKSLYLLFAAYAFNDLSPQANTLQTNLLLSLQHSQHIENYITYHIAQLMWILKRGSIILKNKVVLLWLQNYHDDEIFAKCIERTGQQWVLANFIHASLEISCKRRVLNLLMMMQDSRTKTCNYLMKLLMKPDLSMDTIAVIMDGKPSIPIDCGNKGANKASILMDKCIHLLINFANGDGTLKLKIIQYLYDICLKVKNVPNALSNIMKIPFVQFLIIEFQSSHEKVALLSTKFLIFILTLQQKLKIVLPNQIPFDCYKIANNGDQTFWSLRLYKLLIVCQANGKIRPILKFTQYLGLYQNLFEVLTSKYGHVVLQLLTRLMRKEEKCATSLFNVFAIKVHARRRTLDANFIKFAIDWTTFIANKTYFPIPVEELSAYVKYLKVVDYRGIDYKCLEKYL